MSSYSFSYSYSFFLWLLLAYLSGALPWSVWLSKRFFSTDPRDQPDHNPGAANAFRVGGWPLGLAVLLLDFAKAFLPVAAARWLLGFPSSQLLWLAIMPTVGHAFSLFLRFHGGRGIVTMFGVWAGLTLYQAPLIMGLTAIVATLLIKNDEVRSLSIPLVLIAYLLLASFPTWMILLAVAQLAILAVKIGVFVIQRQTRKRIRNSLMPRHLSALSHAHTCARTFSSLRTLVTGLSHLTALALLASMSLRLLANLRFLRATRRFPAQSPSPLPRVSVLVPARNEAASITACVRSLLAQNHPNSEVLVLDDGSTDGTSQLLDALQRQYPRPQLTVIHTKADPPPGWNGKSYACHLLAQRATGDWLLFTDADTLHTSVSLERGLAQAIALHADLLSALPYQRVETWSERLLVSFIMDFLPLAFVNLAAMWRGRAKRLLANGQYLLARAQPYHALGGHAAIAHALVDDFALARRFRSAGHTLAFIDGAPMLTCRMYRSPCEVWRGFSKNLLIALAPSPEAASSLSPAASPTPQRHPTASSVLSALASALPFAWGYACLFVLPFARLLAPGQRPVSRRLVTLEVSWLLALRGLVVRARSRPPDEVVTTPLAAWAVMAISLAAFYRRWRGRPLIWKQRRYPNPTV